MNKAGLVFVAIIACIAVFFLIPALGMPSGSSDGAPGPGYFPTIISIAVLLLCIPVLLGYRKDKKKYFQQNELQKKNLKRLIIVGGTIVLYTILFQYVPFIPLTIVFAIFLNWIFKQKWVFNIIFSVVITMVLYFIFSKFLHVMIR